MLINSTSFIGQTVGAGTSGSIPYIDSNKKWAQDNTNLAWDETNLKLTIGREIQILPANSTFTGSSNSVLAINNATQALASDQNFAYTKFDGTLNLTAAQTTGSVYGVLNTSTLVNDNALVSTTLSKSYGFYNNPTITSNGGTNVIGESASFVDNTAFNNINSGILIATSQAALESIVSVATSNTLITRRGVWYKANTGAGSITTSIGFDAEATTASNNYVIRSALGASGTNYFLLSTGTAASGLAGSLAVGTISQATAQLDVIAGSSTTKGQIIRGASSQTANLLDFQDSSSNILSNFDLDGHLNLNTAARTISSNQYYILASSGVTTTVSSAATLCALTYQGTYLFTVNQSSFNNGGVVQATPTYKNTSAYTGSIGSVYILFANNPTFTADTNAMTACSVGRGFSDAAGFGVTNGGTLAVSEWNSFISAPASGTGVTTTDRRGLYIKDFAGGTTTTNTGIEIDDLASGTTKISMRIKGTSGHVRIVPKTHVGSDTSPTTQLQVAGDFCTTQSNVTFANPCTVTVTSSNSFKISAASSNFQVNASGPGTAGQTMTILWSADAGGSRTITYGTNFSSTGTQASGGASKFATTTWYSDGTVWRETGRVNNLT